MDANPPSTARDRWTWACLMAALLFAIYISSDYLPNGDMIGNQELPISFVTEGNFELSEFATPPKGDFEMMVARENGGIGQYWLRKSPTGKIVSLFPIAPGILNIPVFVIADFLGKDIVKEQMNLSHITSSMIAALSAMFLFLVLESLFNDRKTSVLFTVAYALGTCVWSIASTGIWQHGPSVLCINIALLLFLHPHKNLNAASGFFFSLSVINRPTNIFFAVAFGLYVLLYRRDILLAFCLWSAVPIALIGWYFQSYWGSFFAPIIAASDSAPTAPGFDHLMEKVPSRLLSPGTGMIAMSPFLIFGMIYMGTLLWEKRTRENTLWKLCALSVVTYFLFYCSIRLQGSYSFGYRYFIEMIPFLTIFAAWQYVSDPSLRIQHFRSASLWFFLGFSIFVQMVGASSKNCTYNSQPKDIIQSPERLWNIVDSRLSRCLKQELFGKEAVQF